MLAEFHLPKSMERKLLDSQVLTGPVRTHVYPHAQLHSDIPGDMCKMFKFCSAALVTKLADERPILPLIQEQRELTNKKQVQSLIGQIRACQLTIQAITAELGNQGLTKDRIAELLNERNVVTVADVTGGGPARHVIDPDQ